MNKKSIGFISLLIGLLLNLTGCSYFDKKISSNPPSQREQTCNELKQNLTFDIQEQQAGISHSPTIDAESARLYSKYKCEEFEQ